MSDLEHRLPSCFGWRPLSVPQVCVGEMTEGLIVRTPVFCYRAKPKGGTQQNTQSQNCCYDNYPDPPGHFVWKLYWQKRVCLRHKHPQTQWCPLATFLLFSPLSQRKRNKDIQIHNHTEQQKNAGWETVNAACSQQGRRLTSAFWVALEAVQWPELIRFSLLPSARTTIHRNIL